MQSTSVKIVVTPHLSGSVVGCGRHDGKTEGGQDVGGGLLTTWIDVELDAFADDEFDRQR